MLRLSKATPSSQERSPVLDVEPYAARSLRCADAAAAVRVAGWTRGAH
ncbi:hypothetical protein N9F40_01715 [bacterium]|nr:hypothetical protein [bacterium]